MKKQQRGFTLVEVLIVVIIIAVLASLILPRFLSQPEKAVAAEANQMMGAITRALNNYVDSGASTAWPAVAAATAANWTTIGMQQPTTTNFTYSCAAGGPCSAVRAAGSGGYAGATITVTNTGAWNCAAAAGTTYSYATATGGGCRAQ